MSEVADSGREEREGEPAVGVWAVDLPDVLGIEGADAEEILRGGSIFGADSEELVAAYRGSPGAGDELEVRVVV